MHSVKEMLFLSSKNGINSFAFSLCPIYKSYIGQTNRKRNKSALLVWAIRRRPFICSDRSRGLLSIMRHRYTHATPLYTALGDTVKKVVEFTTESITSVKACEKHSNSAQNYVKATDIRKNATDVETRRNIVQ